LGSLVIPYSATWEIISTFGIAGVIGWIYLNQQNAFVRNMDWGIVGYLGTISYGLYMWQNVARFFDRQWTIPRSSILAARTMDRRRAHLPSRRYLVSPLRTADPQIRPLSDVNGSTQGCGSCDSTSR
jgi:hypothetical protein